MNYEEGSRGGKEEEEGSRGKEENPGRKSAKEVKQQIKQEVDDDMINFEEEIIDE